MGVEEKQGKTVTGVLEAHQSFKQETQREQGTTTGRGRGTRSSNKNERGRVGTMGTRGVRNENTKCVETEGQKQ